MVHEGNTAFAACRDLIAPSTRNLIPVMGLVQISWSPLPSRSKRQPAALKISVKYNIRLFTAEGARGIGVKFP